jgi:hypothetical protein
MVREMLTLLGTAAPSELGSAVFHTSVFFRVTFEERTRNEFFGASRPRGCRRDTKKGGTIDTMRKKLGAWL